jgi:DNA-binding CsgD family transcriptional regulator
MWDEFSAIAVGELPVEDARALLAATLGVPLGNEVRDRVLSETRGHPLALLAAAADLTPEQARGDAALPDSLPLGRVLDERYAAQIRRLPEKIRLLLLLAAAARDADIEFVISTAASLGIGEEELEWAESEGLVNLGVSVTFVDPLLRASLYGGASGSERRRLHLALANAASGEGMADLRALHGAAAALQRDEQTASDVERAAATAARRGAYARSASLSERAAELTPDANRRAERLLVAAEAKLTAGRPAEAAGLLAGLSSRFVGPTQSARATRLSSLIDLSIGATGRSSAPDLLRAAQALHGVDTGLARDIHLAALLSAAQAGALGAEGALTRVARAARAAPRRPGTQATADLLLDGFASLFLDHPGSAAPILRRAVDLLRRERTLHWLTAGSDAAAELFDEDALHDFANSYVELAATPGATGALPQAFACLGGYHVLVGRFDVAKKNLQRARIAALHQGSSDVAARVEVGDLLIAAWQGHETEARQRAGTVLVDAAARGHGAEMSWTYSALAVLDIGAGRYNEALAALREAIDYGTVDGGSILLPDLIEAAVRSGETGVAVDAVHRLADGIGGSATEWALGMLRRSEALLAVDDRAEPLYREALVHLKRCRVMPQLARARLLYGEWLRRQRRRRDAREQLRAAHELFWSMGARSFAHRSATELVATGELLEARPAGSVAALTAHERRIARLAADGASNPQIAVQLQISHRTVEYHLGKVFRKLGITSRTQLGRLVRDLEDMTAAPGSGTRFGR